eukprot:TRINITY_DN1033_c0_g1_i1.p1 TRINITY_DN1033_c0_g1~~TRINITY_DN1033_c0_g1_i1.p1  ORF type:complete len:343 (+),score=78.03 TRINITY_DN1033_c0_g1_i1:78-1106(+)
MASASTALLPVLLTLLLHCSPTAGVQLALDADPIRLGSHETDCFPMRQLTLQNGQRALSPGSINRAVRGALRKLKLAAGHVRTKAAAVVDLLLHKGQGDDTLLVFGAHHKTGTHLLRNFANFTSAFLGEEKRCVDDGCLKKGLCTSNFARRSPTSRIYFACSLTQDKLAGVKSVSPGGRFRAVHSVRDPLAVVVSGYLYHMIPENTDLNGQDPSIKTMCLNDGIALEARHALNGTIPEMVSAVQSPDARVLTVDLDEFTESSQHFDEAARRVFAHLLGEEQEEAIETLTRLAGAEDLNRGKVEENHIADEDLEEVALRALKAVPAEIMEELQRYRELLGYRQ